jgi:hypothetical protein
LCTSFYSTEREHNFNTEAQRTTNTNTKTGWAGRLRRQDKNRYPAAEGDPAHPVKVMMDRRNVP